MRGRRGRHGAARMRMRPAGDRRRRATVAAVPAAMGTRILLKHYQSKSLLGLRVQDRIARLRALEKRRAAPLADAQLPALPPGVDYVRDED